MRKRILIVGSDKIYAIENYFKKYLEEEGAEIGLFTAQNYFYAYYQKSLLNKILFRASLSGIVKKINTLFKQTVEQFNPDIIWIFKGMEITPASLKWAHGRNIKLVNYNPDNPFLFSGRGSGNSHVTNSISLYDLHFTYNLEVKERLEREYKAKTVFLPFGFDLNNNLFDDCAQQKEILKLCFAGNPDEKRAAFIKKLARAGIPIDVYGNHWEQFINDPSVTVHAPVYGSEFWKILRRYRVQLNLMRLHNENSHNMRSFEVPAVGGIMLAPDTPEHRMFFQDKVDLFLFSTVEECILLAQSILGLSEMEAVKIRQNARARSLLAGYSYKERSKMVFDVFKNMAP